MSKVNLARLRRLAAVLIAASTLVVLSGSLPFARSRRSAWTSKALANLYGPPRKAYSPDLLAPDFVQTLNEQLLALAVDHRTAEGGLLTDARRITQMSPTLHGIERSWTERNDDWKYEVR